MCLTTKILRVCEVVGIYPPSKKNMYVEHGPLENRFALQTDCSAAKQQVLVGGVGGIPAQRESSKTFQSDNCSSSIDVVVRYPLSNCTILEDQGLIA